MPCFSCFAALNDAKTPKSDAKRAMYSAASAECQQTQKAESICLYSGNANFIQGDDKLRAQRIAVYRDTANQIYQIIAFGVQAGDRSYYDTLYALTNEDKGTASDKKPVHAEANVIKLFPLRNKALFIGAAKITRDQDLVTGSYVEYDIEKQTMLARPDLGKQTMMVLNPKQKQS